jgi:galactosylgalactosylxylosylprotein 3-beta-glucuronosyltransferase 1
LREINSVIAEKQSLTDFFNFENFRELTLYPNLVELSKIYNDLPFIYIITPTWRRKTQLAELTRLKNTLWNVPKVHWIIIEDTIKKTNLIAEFLSDCKIPYTHLNEISPRNLSQIKINKETHGKHKASSQRNKAIEWLRENQSKIGPKDVVYFADDDNSYHLQLFEEVYFRFVFSKINLKFH